MAAAPSFSGQQSKRWNGDGDPARGVVLLGRQRRAVADGPRVALGVGVAGEHDLGQAVLGHAVLVHEARRLHGADLGRRQHPVRRRVGGRPPGPAPAPGPAVALELALGQRPVDDDRLGVAGGDGGVGQRHGGAHAVAAAAEGLGGEVQVADAEGGAQPHRLVAVHVRHQAVDVGQREAGVGHGVADGDAGQLELGVRGAAALVVLGLADPDHHRAAVHCTPFRWNRIQLRSGGGSGRKRHRRRRSGRQPLGRFDGEAQAAVDAGRHAGHVDRLALLLAVQVAGVDALEDAHRLPVVEAPVVVDARQVDAGAGGVAVEQLLARRRSRAAAVGGSTTPSASSGDSTHALMQ